MWFPPGTYRMVARPPALELHYNDLPSGWQTVLAVRLRRSQVKICGKAATLRLDAQADPRQHICFVFGNHSSDSLAHVTIQGLAFDLDNTNNGKPDTTGLGTGQPRGLLAIGIAELALQDCRFTGGSTRGGYAVNLHDCKDATLESCSFSELSGGVHAIYCRNLTLASCTWNGFHEGIDLDKVNRSVVIQGCTFERGESERDQAIDSNATIGLKVGDCTFRDCRTVITFNSKGDLAPTFSEHLAGNNTQWRQGAGLELADNTFVECGWALRDEVIAIGDRWRADRPRPDGTRPVNGVRIERNTLSRVGVLLCHEAMDMIVRDNVFEDIALPREGNLWAALTLRSEEHYDTWPLAERGSDLSVEIVGNTIRRSSRGAIHVRQPSKVWIADNVIEQCHGELDHPAAIGVYELGLRNARGGVSGNRVSGGAGYSSGFAFQQALPGAGSLRVTDNRVKGHAVSIALFGDTITPSLRGEQATTNIGPLPAGAPDEDVKLLLVTREALVFALELLPQDDVPIHTSAYIELSLIRFGGSEIVIATADTGPGGLMLEAGMKASLPVPIAFTPVTRLEAGDVAGLRIRNHGAGQTWPECEVTLLYLES